jgi:excinuclease ABC subunit B
VLEKIEAELQERHAWFISRNQLLEAQRIMQRTRFDMEMIREIGYCNGIENYSRFFDGRSPGDPPYTLLDYFPKDFMCIIDESHQSVPQIRAMYAGDRSRKDNLIDYGFRLPCAYDNRPLTFDEFMLKVGQIVFTSATPGPFEKTNSTNVAEQIVRPTGLIDPEVIIRPTKGQIDDLLNEIRIRSAKSERVLVTTLTKKMAEDLTDYLIDLGVKVHYMHSDLQTFVRSEILRDLRMGIYDVVVGINLLREGLDLPEVTLVAILDADKEGFLRSETSLVQTIGRAARNIEGKVIMYADVITESMRKAISETNRRRALQLEYNVLNNITPVTISKGIRDSINTGMMKEETVIYGGDESGRPLDELIAETEKKMQDAAKSLKFEEAASLRDHLIKLQGKSPFDAVKSTKKYPTAKEARRTQNKNKQK